MKTPLLAAVLLPLSALAHPWTPPLEPLHPAPAPVYAVRAPAPVVLHSGGDRADDIKDLWSIDATLAQLDRAAASRSVRLLRWVDGNAGALLDCELRDSHLEADRARFSGDGWALRRAEWKLSEVAPLESSYRSLSWRMDAWSVARRRGILVELDRLNRRELAVRRRMTGR